MTRAGGTGLVLSILFLAAGALAPAGCDADSKNTGAGGGAGSGLGGGAGGQAGAAATGGAAGDTGAGGAVPSLPFMPLLPCNTADVYTTGNTIAYGGPNLIYAPQCLKIAAGEQVTFVPMTSADTFVLHPLNHSQRGTLPSPINQTLTGSMATFTFPTPGFYAYYCEVHGAADDGHFMAGVIWVE